MMDESDAELLDRTRAGAPDAFGRLYERHADSVFRYCVRRIGDRSTGEDLTSVVFLEAWRRRRDVVIDAGESMLPWLLGVATNVLRNQQRSMRRYRRAFARMAPERDTNDFADDVAERLGDRERAGAVAAALDRLPTLEQEVFSLVALGELDYAQAAVALGVPVGTVRSRLSRARARLRAELDQPDIANLVPVEVEP